MTNTDLRNKFCISALAHVLRLRIRGKSSSPHLMQIDKMSVLRREIFWAGISSKNERCNRCSGAHAMMMVSGEFAAGYAYCVLAGLKANSDACLEILRQVVFRKCVRGMDTRPSSSSTTTHHFTFQRARRRSSRVAPQFAPNATYHP